MVYIDREYKCHMSNPDENYRAVTEPFFDNKCAVFVEGYRFVPAGESWSRTGEVSHGKMIAPWKPYAELAAAQAQYERDMAELQTAYQEGVNSV